MSTTDKVCNDLKPCKGHNISLTLSEGEDIVMKCSIFPVWKGIIVWSKEGNRYPLTLGSRRFYPDNRIAAYLSSSNIWLLKIKNSKISDSGIYECSDSSKSEVMLTYKVKVQKHPTNLPKDNERIAKNGAPGIMEIKGPNVAFIGETVNIQCRINLANIVLPPHPFSAFLWFRNGKPQNSDSQSGLTITQSWESSSTLESEVIIKNVDSRFSGSWVCLYALDDSKFSQKNTATASLYLTVLGTPKSSVEDNYSNGKPGKQDTPKILRLKDSEYLNDHEYKSSTDKNNSSLGQKSLNNLIDALFWELILWRTLTLIFDL